MEELERKPKGNLLRKLKRRERAGLYNVLRSIYEDSLFVRELREDILPGIPVLANLRCGAWYSPRFDGDCYFKSTDGHSGKWDFSLSRLNLHVARLAGAEVELAAARTNLFRPRGDRGARDQQKHSRRAPPSSPTSASN